MGRLAYSHAALPAILPASFIVHDQHVVIAERLGSPVARALRGAVVAFGVDSWDGATATGWSVNAVGPSRVVSTPKEVARLDALQAFPRPLLPGRCYITVLIQLLRGWRTTAPAAMGEHLG